MFGEGSNMEKTSFHWKDHRECSPWVEPCGMDRILQVEMGRGLLSGRSAWVRCRMWLIAVSWLIICTVPPSRKSKKLVWQELMNYAWFMYVTVRNLRRQVRAHPQIDVQVELSWLALLGWGSTGEMMKVWIRESWTLRSWGSDFLCLCKELASHIDTPSWFTILNKTNIHTEGNIWFFLWSLT